MSITFYPLNGGSGTDNNDVRESTWTSTITSPPTSGLYYTNDTEIDQITNIEINYLDKSGRSQYGLLYTLQSQGFTTAKIELATESGKRAIYNVGTVTDMTTYIKFAVTFQDGDAGDIGTSDETRIYFHTATGDTKKYDLYGYKYGGTYTAGGSPVTVVDNTFYLSTNYQEICVSSVPPTGYAFDFYNFFYGLQPNTIIKIFSESDKKEVTIKLTSVLALGGAGYFRWAFSVVWSDNLLYYTISWNNNFVLNDEYMLSFDTFQSHTHPWNQITSQPESLETGFDVPANLIVNYDSANRTVTLTGASWVAYWKGTAIPALINGWVSSAHTNANGTYFLYYNGSNFVWSTSVWDFSMLQIALVNKTSSYTFCSKETHGRMNWQTHQHLHQTIGTYLVSGGDISSYTLASTTATDRRPNIGQTIIADEDIQITLPQLLKTDNTNAPYCWFYLNASAVSTIPTGQAEICPNASTGTVLQYNLNTAGTWSLSNFANNNYGKIFLLALTVSDDATSQAYRYVWVAPQSISGTLATIQAITFSSLAFGDFSAVEYTPIAEIIVRQNTGSTWSITSISKISGSRQQLVSTASAGITSVVTDATLTGAGTATLPLSVSSAVFPYYHPQWTCAGTFVHGSIPTITNGSFWIDNTNHEIAIPFVDVNSVDHTEEMKKLDYSSIIHIYNADKTKKNRYVFKLSSVNLGASPPFVIILFDTLNFNEEFTISAISNELCSFEFIYSAIQDIEDLRSMLIATPADNEVLMYSGGLWINRLKEYGIASTTATFTLGGGTGSIINGTPTGTFLSSGISVRPGELGFNNNTSRTLNLLIHFCGIVTKDGTAGTVYIDRLDPSGSFSMIGKSMISNSVTTLTTWCTTVLPAGTGVVFVSYTFGGGSSLAIGARTWIHEIES